MASYKQYRRLAAVLVLAVAVVLEAASASVAVVPPLIPKKVQIQIRNDLEGRESMKVHCKDKRSDFGEEQVPPGASYEFYIVPNGLDDYFCSFVFNGVLHWFDIFLAERDGVCARDTVCSWSTREVGPCSANPSQCYGWNP